MTVHGEAARGRERPQTEEPARQPRDPDLDQVQLKSLAPRYEDNKHRAYVELLRRGILDGHSNIALAGAFGTGKSSVLEGLTRDRRIRRRNPVVISLTALPLTRSALLSATGETEAAAAVQKEVVRRLLYVRRPFVFRVFAPMRVTWAALAVGLLVGLLLALATSAVLVALGLGGAAEVFFDDQALSPWITRGIDFGLLTFIGAGFYLTVRAVQLREVAIGPAKFVMADKKGTYFDKNIDGIIDSIRATRTRVVVFEDLDRFKDPSIFQSLGELNAIINSAVSSRRRVTFVYAIRDSIFVPSANTRAGDNAAEVDEHVAVAARRRVGADTPAADRAKFFDLVVPLVPFISHSTAADLLQEALEPLPEKWRPEPALIALAGEHFTDMRVIESIVNEYVVFLRQLLLPSKIQHLDHNQMFAVVCYKHTDLADFEAIRTHNSKLDTLQARLDEAVEDKVKELDESIATAWKRVDELSHAEHAASAGKRLAESLAVRFAPFKGSRATKISLPGPRTQSFSTAKWESEDFWRALEESGESQQINVDFSAGLPTATFTAEEFQELLGDDFPFDTWLTTESHLEISQIGELTTARDHLASSTLSQLAGRPFGHSDEGEPIVDLRPVAVECLGTGLLLKLVRAGFINHHYPLYTTAYYGRFVSAEARTFMISAIDRRISRPRFALSDEDVSNLFDIVGTQFLGSPAGLNVSVIEYVLGRGTGVEAIAYISTLSAQDASPFLELFVSESNRKHDLVRRLAPVWPNLLEWISGATALEDTTRASLLASAVQYLNPDIDYSLPDDARTYLKNAMPTSRGLQERFSRDQAAGAASVLLALDAPVPDLAVVPSVPLRRELVANGLVVPSLLNMAAVTGSPQSVGLDSLHDQSTALYKRALGDIDFYLDEVLSGEEDVHTFDTPDGLTRVASDLQTIGTSQLDRVLAHTSPDAVVTEGGELGPEMLNALARHQRLLLTSGNIVAYFDTVGAIDDDLAGALESAFSLVKPDGADDTASDDQTAAIYVLNAENLSRDTKCRLIESLGIDEIDDLDDLTLEDGELLDWLFDEELIESTPSAVAQLTGISWITLNQSTAALSALDGQVARLDPTPAQLLQLIHNPKADEVLIDAAEAAFDAVGSAVGKDVATRCVTAARQGADAMSVPRLMAMVAAGASTGSTVSYLARFGHTLSDDQFTAVLQAMPSPFDTLTVRSRDMRRVRPTPGIESVFKRLQAMGIIKSQPKLKSGEYRVFTRH